MKEEGLRNGIKPSLFPSVISPFDHRRGLEYEPLPSCDLRWQPPIGEVPTKYQVVLGANVVDGATCLTIFNFLVRIPLVSGVDKTEEMSSSILIRKN